MNPTERGDDERQAGRRSRWRAASFVVALLALALALRSLPSRIEGRRAPRDVVLVVVDTLRAAVTMVSRKAT